MNTQARHHFAKARRRERPPTLRREDEPRLRLLLPLEPTPPKARKTIPYVRRGHPSKREARGMGNPDLPFRDHPRLLVLFCVECRLGRR